MLVGVRANAEKVSVKLMSTGTREQLYLALRLASLERHVELHGPMTVILDDVVLHSDPKRKSAILRALADLGERTQVIAFTHDPHVIALAQNTIDPGRLVVHELGGSEITGSPQLKIDASEVRPIARAIAAWHRHLPTDQQDRAQRSRSSMTVARHSHTLGVQSSVAGALGNSTEGQSTSAAGVQGSVAHTEYSEVIDAAEQMAAPASLSGMFGEVQQESTEPSEGESSV
jgi:hypothetical protein